MKRQSLVLLAVAFVAAGAVGCFKDPVSGLRNGPAVLSVNQTVVLLKAGDSTAVIAYLKDLGGNVLAATGVTWTSGNTAIAVVNVPVDANGNPTPPIPGNAYTRANIRGVDSVSGGETTVIVASRNIADTIRVVVIPSKLTTLGHVAYAGPSLTDTVIVPASVLPPAPAKFNAYTAKDTLILNGTSLLTFDTSKVTVTVATTNGASNGFIVSKTPAQIKVLFEVGTAGKVMVQHLLLNTGVAAVGTIKVDTLIGDSVAVAPYRLGVASGTTVGVTSNVLTVGLPANMSFSGATTASFAGSPVAIIAQSAQSLSFFSTVPTTSATVTVYKVQMTGGTGVATVTFDSLSSNVGTFTLSPANLPNANVAMSPNNAKLGDTVIITAPAGMAFSTTAPVSRVLVGNQAITTSDTAWNLSLTAGTLKVFPKRGGSGHVTVTNMVLPVTGAVPFALTTPGTTTIDSIASDFPVATSFATAHVAVIPANDTLIVYGAGNPAGLLDDYWTFTTTATWTIYGQISWFGNGNPYGTTAPSLPAYTPDFDLILCSATTQAGCNGSSESSDLMGFAAATASQPQQGSAAAQPAGQYWFDAMNFTGPYTAVYKLMIVLK